MKSEIKHLRLFHTTRFYFVANLLHMFEDISIQIMPQHLCKVLITQPQSSTKVFDLFQHGHFLFCRMVSCLHKLLQSNPAPACSDPHVPLPFLVHCLTFSPTLLPCQFLSFPHTHFGRRTFQHSHHSF